MIARLRELACASDACADLSSELSWDAPGTVRELAVVALLACDEAAWSDLPEDVRLQLARSIPDAPADSPSHRMVFFETIILALARFPDSVAECERSLLLGRVRGMGSGEVADRWRLLLVASFFAKTDDDIGEDEVLAEVQARVELPAMPFVATYFLVGVERRDAARLEGAVEQVVAALDRVEGDVVPTVIRLAEVFGAILEPARSIAFGSLRRFLIRREVVDDPRVVVALAASSEPSP